MSFDPTMFLAIPVLLLAVTVHELAHALVAYWGGDDTAALQGRITLNPIPHIDLLGSIIVPGFLLLSGSGFLFGWAKPVPVNPNRLKNRTWDIWVSLAGPASNVLLVIVSAVLLKLLYVIFGGKELSESLVNVVLALKGMLVYGVIINVVLAIFNLIPVPPLDGSHIFRHLFLSNNPRAAAAYDQIGIFGILIVVVLIRGPLGGLIGGAIRFTSIVMEAVLGIPLG